MTRGVPEKPSKTREFLREIVVVATRNGKAVAREKAEEFAARVVPNGQNFPVGRAG